MKPHFPAAHQFNTTYEPDPVWGTNKICHTLINEHFTQPGIPDILKLVLIVFVIYIAFKLWQGGCKGKTTS